MAYSANLCIDTVLDMCSYCNNTFFTNIFFYGYHVILVHHESESIQKLLRCQDPTGGPTNQPAYISVPKGYNKAEFVVTLLLQVVKLQLELLKMYSLSFSKETLCMLSRVCVCLQVSSRFLEDSTDTLTRGLSCSSKHRVSQV